MQNDLKIFRNHRFILIFLVAFLILAAIATIILFNKNYFQSRADSITNGGNGTIYATIKDANGAPTWSGIPVQAVDTVNGKIVDIENSVTDYSGTAKFVGVENGSWKITYTDPGCTSHPNLTATINNYSFIADLTGSLCPIKLPNTFSISGKVVGPGNLQMPVSALIGSGTSRIQTKSDSNTGKFLLSGMVYANEPSSSYTITVGGINGDKILNFTLAQLGLITKPLAGQTYVIPNTIQMQNTPTPPKPPSTNPDIYFTVKTDCTVTNCTNRDARGRVSGLPVSIEYSNLSETTNNNLNLFADRDYNGEFKNVSIGYPIFLINSKTSPNYNPAYETFTANIPAMTESNYAIDGSDFYYVAEFVIHQKSSAIGSSLSGTVSNSEGSADGLIVSYGGASTTTDANGKYSLTGFSTGNAGLTVCPSYYSNITKLTSEPNQKITNFNLVITPAPYFANTGCNP